jgi:hypothetical protein
MIGADMVVGRAANGVPQVSQCSGTKHMRLSQSWHTDILQLSEGGQGRCTRGTHCSANAWHKEDLESKKILQIIN